VTSDLQTLLARARAGKNEDPDPTTAAELGSLIDGATSGVARAVTELDERFQGHVRFGTAGLRAPLGAGPTRMNRVVVAHAAYSLGRYLQDTSDQSGTPSVVIGFDARTLSDVFARDTAEILSGLGIRALLFDRHTPTPVLAFAVRHYSADAGVMVTASHNPPADNGYKVYLGGKDGGAQIVSPVDREVHQRIIASHDEQSAGDIRRSDSSIELMGEGVIAEYIRHTASLIDASDDVDKHSLRVCYTPLHGVGAEVFLRLLDATGFAPPIVVESQATPDPLFPTVSFPNPEEPGALDASFETANHNDCDLIIAHDPDADRLAVAVPDSHSPGGWTALSGNDLGILLLADVAEQAARDARVGTLACSLVSTPMVSKLAVRNGLEFVSTPTGFKWISRVENLLAGFEEAIGYLVNPDTVRDKDGISAGLYLLHLAHRLHARGMTLTDRLAEIAADYGGWASETISVRLASVDQVTELMAAIRQSPDTFSPVEGGSITDYLHNAPEGFPATNLIQMAWPNGARIIIRPSGTEPKIKIYIDALDIDRGKATDTVSGLARVTRARLQDLTGDNGGV